MRIETISNINKSELLATIDTIENSFEENISGQLDVFDHILSKEEVERTSLYSKNYFVDHHLKYEPNYIEFIDKVVIENNDSEILIEIDFEEFEAQKILQTIETLDLLDKYLWIDLVKEFKSFSTGFISTSDKAIIRLLFKLATREITFPIFHFDDKNVAISGNFDLSFPIFFSNEGFVDKYSEIAKDVGLNIIDIKMPAHNSGE